MRWKKMLSLGLLMIGASCFAVGSDVSAKSIEKTDPEMSAVLERYVYNDTVKQSKAISDTNRELVRIASIATIGSQNYLEIETDKALKLGVTPLEIREAIYQITPYIGFARSTDALETINKVFKAHGIKLPLENQGTVDDSNRFDKGLGVQIEIFGDHIREMRKNAPADAAHFNDDLAEFCFGDTYTRGTLDLKQREMLTMAAIASLGGCEPQLKGHIAGNKSVGNTRAEVIAVLTAINPFIGFPRTLNALACINEVMPPESN